MAFPIAPTRRAGFERLHAFLPNSGHRYAKNRNGDYGPDDRGNVSMLSGHLRHRLILESEVLDAVLDRYAPSTAEKFIQEVFWRNYFKGWLEQHPTVWRTYRRDVADLLARCDTDDDLAQRYNQAVGGGTGIDCFDAWSRELVETGYLHNHARMWFASIWIFTLGLPWQLGADFFYRHLIDGDPASNTLSWRWVGGLHTRGKTYLARPSNIEKYTGGRFAPYGQLATSASPLNEDEAHARQPLRAMPADLGSEPIALLVTEEDCCVESLFKDLQPAAGLTLLATPARSPAAVGSLACDFAQYATADSSARAAEYFQCPFQPPSASEDWGDELKNFAEAQGIRTIVTAYAPVGPVAERLSHARMQLADHGIALVEVRRVYDDLCWPHATRGFFSLKKKIPAILEELQCTAPG